MSDLERGYLYGGISLVSGVAGIVIVLFLLIFGIKAMSIDSVVILAGVAFVLLPLAYFTNRAGRSLRQ